jgi:DNA modification methylase
MGDPWTRKEVIGDCTLYLGDCLEVMPALGKVDAVVTDPPYGINYNPTRSQSSSSSGTRKAAKKVKGDDKPFDPTPFLVTDKWLFWGGNNFSHKLPGAAGWLAWDKRDSGTLFRGFMMSDFELAASNFIGRTQVISHKWCGHLRQSERDLFVHPTQKPVAVMEWCLGFLPNAETFLDPFMGSGTTLVACAKLGRKGIGIELDPEYFEIACKRVQAAYDQPDLFVAPPTAPTQEGMDL